MTMRERCKAFYQKAQMDAMTRTGSPVDDLMEFVISEIGRKADASLDDTLPVCCYFSTPEDRDGFVTAMLEAKPNMIARKVL